MNVGYLVRHRQRGYVKTWTGSVVYSLEDAIDICRRRNEFWKGETTEWPVEYELDEEKGSPLREIESVDLPTALAPRTP